MNFFEVSMHKQKYLTLIAVILLVGCMPSNISPTQSPTLVLSPTPTQTIEPEPTPTGTPTQIVETKSFVEQIQTEFINLQEMKTEYSNQFSSIPMNINFFVSPTASDDYAWRSLDDLEATKPNKFGDDPAESVARALMHGLNEAWKKAGNAADLTTEISKNKVGIPLEMDVTTLNGLVKEQKNFHPLDPVTGNPRNINFVFISNPSANHPLEEAPIEKVKLPRNISSSLYTGTTMDEQGNLYIIVGNFPAIVFLEGDIGVSRMTAVLLSYAIGGMYWADGDPGFNEFYDVVGTERSPMMQAFTTRDGNYIFEGTYTKKK